MFGASWGIRALVGCLIDVCLALVLGALRMPQKVTAALRMFAYGMTVDLWDEYLWMSKPHVSKHGQVCY